MNCKFVYAFVPEVSFEKIVDDRAEEVTMALIERVSNTMSLESQLTDADEIRRQKEELKFDLKRNLKEIWKYEI